MSATHAGQRMTAKGPMFNVTRRHAVRREKGHAWTSPASSGPRAVIVAPRDTGAIAEMLNSALCAGSRTRGVAR